MALQNAKMPLARASEPTALERLPTGWFSTKSYAYLLTYLHTYYFVDQIN